jgi:hypothetical protein
MLLSLCIGLAACSAPSNQPRVFFTSPSDGASVTNPVKFTMDSQNFIIEPAGAVRPGAGHLHILVDTPAIPVGQVVPKDEKHNHYGQGQKEAELTLSPGTHTLILQGTDGAHVVLPGEGMTQKITVTVK